MLGLAIKKMMETLDNKLDALIIGGGFYGVMIALHLQEQKKDARIIIVEKENDIMSRASLNNQARIHKGYHYPRSRLTAIRSAINEKKFLKMFNGAVTHNTKSFYGVARKGSKVSSRQFVQFCESIGIPLTKVSEDMLPANSALIEDVFSVEEQFFSAVKLRDILKKRLEKQGIQVLAGTTVEKIEINPNGFCARLATSEAFNCKMVFNCTYSELGRFCHLGHEFPGLKHEFTEIAHVRLPKRYENIAVTLMDGSFFSVTPQPFSGLHNLTHVTYTPHFNWIEGDSDSFSLGEYSVSNIKSRAGWMMRDLFRYFPSLRVAEYVGSSYETKTVLTANEKDDGRPIFFQRSKKCPGFYSILGGKIDNIFDIQELLSRDQFVKAWSKAR